jgi:hypothetical protein
VLNWAAGDTIANTTSVPIVPGGGNDFSIYSSSGAHVVSDVLGYYAAPGAIQIAGPIRMGSETGTSQLPTTIGGATVETAYAGMVVRRILSNDFSAGSVVARTPPIRSSGEMDRMAVFRFGPQATAKPSKWPCGELLSAPAAR